ncbi:unnamed protein product [Schistosoma mattheei]|uniref:Uncharacterized protein n=1 Tax=Schistosoma mattheei TaxID=31246 RepID=A0A183NWE3_9TREM|nr:unnamed protein product [Schistosoma mattheei]
MCESSRVFPSDNQHDSDAAFPQGGMGTQDHCIHDQPPSSIPVIPPTSTFNAKRPLSASPSSVIIANDSSAQNTVPGLLKPRSKPHIGAFNVRTLCQIGQQASLARTLESRTIDIFALVFLAVLESGILYTILSQWLRHLEVGVTFAVQMFQPGLEDKTVMANIQEALHCCGRGSYDDYDVANEAIPKQHVPYSCCDLQTYTNEHCNNASKLTKNKLTSLTIQSPEMNNLFYVIPYYLAYPEGCVNRLKNLFLPIVIGCFCLLISVNIIATFINCFYVQKAADEEEYEQNWLDSQNFLKETKEAFCLKPKKQVEISCDASISNVDDLSVFQGQLSRRRTSSIPSDTD